MCHDIDAEHGMDRVLESIRHVCLNLFRRIVQVL